MSSTPVRLTRVLIVDDHPAFCEGLGAVLQRTDEFEVVGKAWTGDVGLAMTRELRPELIVLDISLGNDEAKAEGLNLMHQLRRICPDVKIAILTGSSAQEHLVGALLNGAEAFLQKDIAPSRLIDALRLVRDGERVIGSPQNTAVALTQLQEFFQEHVRAKSDLTEVELKMLRLAAAGLTNKEIGVQQFWSEITVKRKMQSAYRKLAVKTRAQAVGEAIRRGLV